jgi:hypothetical protein
MKTSILTATLGLASVATTTSQFAHLGRLIPPVEETDEFPSFPEMNDAGNSTVNVTGSSFFTQLLDHDNPSKGTFQQKFWWNSQDWEGPGSPVCYSEEVDENATKA